MLKSVITSVFALGLLLGATAASAQEVAPPQPATAEQIAAARATADRLIAASGGPEFFVNSTKDDGLASVTHTPSGMTCRFGGHQRDRVALLPTQSDAVPRGYDVGCVSYDPGLDIDMTLYATRYRPMPSEDQDMAATVHGIRARWPDARPHEGEFVTIEQEGHSAAKAAAFDVRMDNMDKVTLALITHRDAWAFKARLTGPREQAMGVSLYGNVMLMSALMDRNATAD